MSFSTSITAGSFETHGGFGEVTGAVVVILEHAEQLFQAGVRDENRSDPIV